MDRRSILLHLAGGGLGILASGCRCSPKFQTMVDIHEVPGSAILEASPLPLFPNGDKDASEDFQYISNHAVWLAASRWAKSYDSNYLCAFWTGIVSGGPGVLTTHFRIACIKRRLGTVIASDIQEMNAESAMAEADRIAVERSPGYIAGLWDGEMAQKPGERRRFTHNVIAIKDMGWASIETFVSDLGPIDSLAQMYAAQNLRSINSWAISSKTYRSSSSCIAAFPLFREGSLPQGSSISVVCFKGHKT